MTWEVDEFEGVNKGLILAEVELSNESEKIDLPEWIDQEVSFDPKYSNINLARDPFTK